MDNVIMDSDFFLPFVSIEIPGVNDIGNILEFCADIVNGVMPAEQSEEEIQSKGFTHRGYMAKMFKQTTTTRVKPLTLHAYDDDIFTEGNLLPSAQLTPVPSARLSTALAPWQAVIDGNKAATPSLPSPTVNDFMQNEAHRRAYRAENALRDIRQRLADKHPEKAFVDGMTVDFFGFPPEIRVRIYKLVVVSDIAIDTNDNHEYRFCNWVPPPLLAVSKMVREEASQVYYGENEFKISLKCSMLGGAWAFVPTSVISRLAKRIGANQAALVRRLNVEFDITNIDAKKSISVTATPARKQLSVTFHTEEFSERAQESIFNLQSAVEQRMKTRTVLKGGAIDFFTMDPEAFEFEIIGDGERQAKGSFSDEELRD